MIGEIKITERGATPGILKRELNKLMKKAFEAAGIHWHQEIRPKHFTSAGAGEYGYAARKGERGNVGTHGFARTYTGRKLKAYGHTQPLVLTGESQGMTRMRDVRATSKKVRIVLRAPKLNFRNPDSQANPRAELTAVSQRDAAAMVRCYERALDAGIKQVRSTKSKTIK